MRPYCATELFFSPFAERFLVRPGRVDQREIVGAARSCSKGARA
jgi:hypothetical protein